MIMPITRFKKYQVLMACICVVSCQDFSSFDCFNERSGCNPQATDMNQTDSSWTERGDLSIIDASILPIDMIIDMEVQVDSMPPNCGLENEMVTCQRCTNGELINSNDDQLCMEVDCGEFTEYRLENVEDRPLVCKINSFSRKSNLCEEGRCLTGERACQADEVMIAADITDNEECMIMRGCQGEIPPETMINVGAGCLNDTGRCNESGVCEVPQSTCPSMGDYFKLCADNQVQNDTCDFNVNLLLGAGILSDKHCNDFCIDISGHCEEAWNTSSTRSCDKVSGRACDQRGGLVICRCRF